MGIEPTSEAWEVLEFAVRVISRTVLWGAISDGRLYRDSTREAADVFALG